MSQSELSDTSVAGEERESLVQDWEEQPEVVISKLWKKMEEINEKLDKLNGGDQPKGSEQKQVWDDENDLPGCPETSKIIKKLKSAEDQGKKRIPTRAVMQIWGCSRQRALDVMDELDMKHEKIDKKNLGGNKGSYLYWRQN